MRRTPLLGAVLLILLAAGCGQSPPGGSPGPTSGSTSGPGATASASSPSASASVPASPGATPSQAVSEPPTVPDASSALDVSATVDAAGFASFASPSGKIWCALYDSNALCHFPYDFTGKIPSWKTICPDEELDVTGVIVEAKGPHYFCSGDPQSMPQLQDSDSAETTGWWKATGWPSVTLDGQKLATLPYGKALVVGDYVCASATNGMTCANTATGKGFRMARAGVTFIG